MSVELSGGTSAIAGVSPNLFTINSNASLATCSITEQLATSTPAAQTASPVLNGQKLLSVVVTPTNCQNGITLNGVSIQIGGVNGLGSGAELNMLKNIVIKDGITTVSSSPIVNTQANNIVQLTSGYTIQNNIPKILDVYGDIVGMEDKVKVGFGVTSATDVQSGTSANYPEVITWGNLFTLVQP
jgi:hypothetical protein